MPTHRTDDHAERLRVLSPRIVPLPKEAAERLVVELARLLRHEGLAERAARR